LTYCAGMKRGSVENKTGILCWLLTPSVFDRTAKSMLSVNDLSDTESLS
jgi:hypothetical protein